MTRTCRYALLNTFFAVQLVAVGPLRAATLNFDNISPGRDSIAMPSGYGGLQWNNFGVYCGACRPASEGYNTGMISPTNVAFNIYGDPASITRSSAFDLTSAYLTAALNIDVSVQVRVQGFLGGNQIYDNTYVVNRSSPTLANFNYSGVDRVTFTSSPAIQFAMDDLIVAFPGGCNVAVTPGGRTHGHGSETGTVSVVTGVGCNWNVVNTNGWVTILSASSNANSGTATYALAANASPLSRSGFIEIGGQIFSVVQSGIPSPAVELGTVEVSSVGHQFFNPFPFPPGRSTTYFVTDLLVDQSQSSGGGSALLPVSVNWDTNNQFVLTVAAPAGKKFLVQVPVGHEVRVSGSMDWRSTAGGGGPVGPVEVSFMELEGAAPDFAGSDAVLSSSHGWFGFWEVTSSKFTNDFAFTAMTLKGTVLPVYTGNGTESYTPHPAASLRLTYTTSVTNDPGRFVSIVPVDPAPSAEIASVSAEGVTVSVPGRAKRTGRLVVIESSEDLRNWTPISTNIVPSTFMDEAGRTAPQRFYRTRELR